MEDNWQCIFLDLMSFIVIFWNTILYCKCAFIVRLLNKRLLTWNLISFADCNPNQNTNKQLNFVLSLIFKKNFSRIYCEFLGTESLISWSIKYLILSINLTYDKRKTAVAAFWFALTISAKILYQQYYVFLDLGMSISTYWNLQFNIVAGMIQSDNSKNPELK